VPLTVTALDDAELKVLDGLAADVDDSARDERLLARRLRAIRASRAKGRSWEDILSHESSPGTMELTSRVLRGITRASGAIRRTVARGLHANGATIAAIAERFGVSRQRVSALLRRRREDG
jgi:predicted DNA binding protein